MLNNMKQMSLGMLQYIQDNDSRFPPLMGNYRMTLMPYAGDSKVFLCPAGPQVSSQEYSSYDRMEWVTEVDLKRGIVYGKHESEVADTTTISLFELIGDAEEHQKITSTCSSSRRWECGTGRGQLRLCRWAREVVLCTASVGRRLL
jgi:hypothetical protein